jgi:hypothetical protein
LVKTHIDKINSYKNTSNKDMKNGLSIYATPPGKQRINKEKTQNQKKY